MANSDTNVDAMDKRTLQDYVAEHGQTTTAKRAGVTQGAIWQMLESTRKIFVDEDLGETITLKEIRKIKRRSVA